ncbi:MAG: hypothetical protein AB7W16_22040 [Candidatus Obscuribacterales bacterium]
MSEGVKRKCPGCGCEDIFETEWVAWDSEGVDAVLVKKGRILKDMERPVCIVCLDCGLVSNYLTTEQIGKIKAARDTQTAEQH